MKRLGTAIITILIATLIFSLAGLAGFAREADDYSITIHWENSEEWDAEELQECIRVNGELIPINQISVSGNDIHITGLMKEDHLSFRPASYGTLGSGGEVQRTTVVREGTTTIEPEDEITLVELEEDISIVELEDEEVPLAKVHLYNNIGTVAKAEFTSNTTIVAAIGMSLLGFAIVICITGLFTLTGHRKYRDE